MGAPPMPIWQHSLVALVAMLALVVLLVTRSLFLGIPLALDSPSKWQRPTPRSSAIPRWRWSQAPSPLLLLCLLPKGLLLRPRDSRVQQTLRMLGVPLVAVPTPIPKREALALTSIQWVVFLTNGGAT